MSTPRLTALARHFAARRFWQWAPLLAPGLAVANPTGADVVAGSVAIGSTDPNTLTLDQASATAAINWQNFSIGAGEYVIFNQPSASALALNRVVGGTPSEIFGHLLANGRVFLVNPSGVLFGQTATVDVGALMVSTANISDQDFAAGRFVFTGAGDASIVNDGHIVAARGGFVVLAADSVSNNGLIQASVGQVVLASGRAFTLDLTGDGLIGFAVDEAALSDRAGVANLGQIVADGGRVLLTARTAAALARTVVNNEGLVQARSIAEGEHGEIVLAAEGGDVANAGTLDASGVNGQDGGSVTLTGDGHAALAPTSRILATGDGPDAGGSVHISGESVTVRGLVALGPGGRLVLDPVDLHIVDGTGSATSAAVYERWVEDQLRTGADVTLTATHSITLDALTDGALDGRGSLALNDGTRGAPAGAGNGGGLTLGIGSQSYGNFFRGAGSPAPGGGIHFANLANAITVNRSLKIVGGASYGSLGLGNLSAGGDILLDAAGNISAGTLVAGGGVKVTTTKGDIVIGDTAAKGSASFYTAFGNLDLDDVVVTPNGGPVSRISLTALGSGSGVGAILDRDATDLLSVGNYGGQASFFAQAANTVEINHLVVQGGGGSAAPQAAAPPVNQMADVTISAGGDLVVHQAEIQTQPFHWQGGFAAGTTPSSDRFTRDDAGAQVNLNAGGNVTLGDTAGGFTVAGYGSGLNTNGFGADVSIGAAGDIVLANVAIKAAAAHGSRTFTNSFSHGASSASLGNLRVNARAGRDLVFAAGGNFAAHGNANISLVGQAGRDILVNGALTVDAPGGMFVRSKDWGPSNSHHQVTSSANHYAGLSLMLSAQDDVVVGSTGAINVALPGDAALWLTGSDYGSDAVHGIAVAGDLGIAAAAKFTKRSDRFSTAPSTVTYTSQDSASEGFAQLHLRAGGAYGDVDIASGALISVSGVGRSSFCACSIGPAALVDISASHDVLVQGDIGVSATRGWSKNRFTQTGYDNSSYADAGAAALQVYAGGAITIGSYGGARVQGAGAAQLRLDAGGALGVDGPLSVAATRGVHVRKTLSSGVTKTPSGSGSYQTTFANSSADSGSSGVARVQLQSRNGDVTLGAALDLGAAGSASFAAWANAFGGSSTGAGTLAVNTPITIAAGTGTRSITATHDSTTIFQPPAGSTVPVSHHHTFTSDGGSQGKARLYLSAYGNVTQAAGAGLDVSGYGSSVAVDVNAYRGNVTAAGPVAVTAFATAHHHRGSGSSSGSGATHSRGSADDALYGAGAIRIKAYRNGAPGAGNVAAGSLRATGAGDATIAVGASSSGGAVVVNGPVAAVSGAGQFKSSNHQVNDPAGAGFSSGYGASSGTAGAAHVRLSANQNVTVNGAVGASGGGSASASFYAANGDAAVTGAITIVSGRGTISNSRFSAYTSGSGNHSEYSSASGAAGGHARLYVQAGGNATLGGVSVTGIGAGGAPALASFTALTQAALIRPGFGGGADVRVNAAGTVTLGNLVADGQTGTHTRRWTNLNSGASLTSGYGSSGDARGSARVDVHGSQGVTLAGLAVSAAGDAGASITALPGNVVISGAAQVVSTHGRHDDTRFHRVQTASGVTSGHSSNAFYGGFARLRAYSGAGDVSLQAITVSAPGDASASLGASGGALAVGGPVSITATRGLRTHHGDNASAPLAGSASSAVADSSASFGSASLGARGKTGVTLGGTVTVSGDGAARAALAATNGAVNAPDAIVVTASRGTRRSHDVTTVGGVITSSFAASGSYGNAALAARGFAGAGVAGVTLGGITVTADNGSAGVSLNGSYSSGAAGEVFGARAATVLVDGLDVHLGGAAAIGFLGVHAARNIDAGFSYGSSMNLFANAAAFRAGGAIDLTGGRLGLGSGLAPFGDDPTAEFLLQVAAGATVDLTPNGAFSAPSVTFGTLNLAGSAIYLQADAVAYNGAITIANAASLPAGGYVVHYDSYTPDATIHVLDTSAGYTPVAGDVYYDQGDFAYPGTTYVIGSALSAGPVIVGENGAAFGGVGGDDNFFFLTNGGVDFVNAIATTGQVFVLAPLPTLAALTQQPITQNFAVGTGNGNGNGDQEDQEDSLEHEPQPQTGGGGAGGEGAVDQTTASGLECH